MWYNLFWASLCLINREAVNEKCKLFQTRLYKLTCSQISNIPYNLIFTTKFNDSSILITNISCDYLNLPSANKYVGDVTIPTQVIKYNQNFHQADQLIWLQYSNQTKLLKESLNSDCQQFYQYQQNEQSPLTSTH
jgi:hypothetical protein